MLDEMSGGPPCGIVRPAYAQRSSMPEPPGPHTKSKTVASKAEEMEDARMMNPAPSLLASFLTHGMLLGLCRQRRAGWLGGDSCWFRARMSMWLKATAVPDSVYRDMVASWTSRVLDSHG